MSKIYLVRAEIRGVYPELSVLPSKFGEFVLDCSPNFEIWAFSEGVHEPPPGKSPPEPDYDYPVSAMYLDVEIKVEEDRLYEEAEAILNQLQGMLRLFKPGGIYVRRHKLWEVNTRDPSKRIEHDPLSISSIWTQLEYLNAETIPIPLYARDKYDLDNDTWKGFVEFFDAYWDIICQKLQPVYNALLRLSSSYEKRTLADRLVDLMIAMEALFGGRGESTYKIALRSSCMLYPAGEAREGAFKSIKKFYDERSDIVHGRSLTSKSDYQSIDQFEWYVRTLICKFLELHRKKRLLLHSSSKKFDEFEKELDKYLFFTKHD
ncbi:MAG: hypothetical protein HY664_03350 [Chloroflexi bacterium]|nr:hypothetical protein [Chloroflexota bacterium]